MQFQEPPEELALSAIKLYVRKFKAYSKCIVPLLPYGNTEIQHIMHFSNDYKNEKPNTYYNHTYLHTI